MASGRNTRGHHSCGLRLQISQDGQDGGGGSEIRGKHVSRCSYGPPTTSEIVFVPASIASARAKR